MSSQGRSRPYEMGRPKEDMSSYRDSPYPSKSRNDMDSRKRDSYSSRVGGRGGMGEKHREPYPSKPSRRSMEDHKDPYMSSGDKREPAPYKRGREREREEYSRGGRERDYSMDSRNDNSFHSRGGRESFHSRGGRDSFHSRGGRGSFLMRGSRDAMSRGSYGSRGARDSFSMRGSYISGRGGRPSFSRGTYGSRGGREPFSMRGSRGSSRGFIRGSYRGSKSDHFVSHLGPQAHMELTKKLVASVLEDSDGRGHFGDERPYRSKEFRREGRGFFHRDSDRHFKEAPRNFSHHTPPYIHEEKMIKRERSASASHFDKEKFRYSERSKLRLRDKFRGPPPKRIHDDDGDFDLEEEPPVKFPRLSRRGRDRESPFDDFDRRPSRSYSPPPRSTSREEPPPRKTSKEGERVKRKGDREGVVKGKTDEERPKAVEKRRPRKISGEEDDEVEDRPEAEEVLDEEDTEVKEEDDDDDRDQDLDEDRRPSSSRLKAKRKFSREEEEEEEEDDEDEKYDSRRRHRGRGGDSSPSGMQVTIRSDGERAVNREGRVKARIAGGKVFVDLQCPHCPIQMGSAVVTFKEYRYHLDSRSHRAKFDKLAFKHSIVLRRIRLQQRNEQRAMEEKWEVEHPEEFSITVSRFCKFCKLAFKCVPENDSAKGIAEHNESKLHKVQQRYLYPRCSTCRMSFPSRLVYEYHIASIRHLRMRTFCTEGYAETQSKDEDPRGEREEVDLTNFITMDSVGEDEEVGSEQEEITGKLEDIEKAEEDAKEGDEEEDEPLEEGRRRREHGTSSPLGTEREEDPFEVDLEEEPLDHEVEDMPDPADEENDISGKEYVVPMEAFYCKLCRKAIRIDTDIGEEAIDRHCRSTRHLNEYNYLGSEEFLEEHGEHFDEGHLQEERDEVDERDHTFDGEEDRRSAELEEEIADENGEGDGSHGPSDDDEDPDEGAVEADGKAVKRGKVIIVSRSR